MTAGVGVRLGITPDSRWDIDGVSLVTAAAAAGFPDVGLGPVLADPAGCAAALARTGLNCHELLALPVKSAAESTVATAAALVEAAAVVRPDWVLTVLRNGLGPDTAPVIARCAAMFAEVGTRLAVEFSPLGPVASMADALAVVEAAGQDRAGVLIDTWHFFRGPSTWQDLETVPLEKIAYLQFDDALDPISDDTMGETMNRRALPGAGTFELERFAATLLERGWEGTVSLEVLSAELLELPVPEFLDRAYRAAAPYWS
jgi:sugar phosphate isomerase/epimerase